MAFTDNTVYCGKEALGFYSKALLTGETKSLIKLVANVKSTIKIASLDLSSIVFADDCLFTDAGNTVLAQKTLTVCPLKVNLEYCTRDFEINYLSEQLRPGSNSDELPASFEAYIVDQVMLNVNAFLENLIWQGNTEASPASACDGFLVMFDADATVIDVTGTTLSASNILAELAKVYAAIPNTIINNKELVFFVSNAAAKFYRQALSASFPALIAANTTDVPLIYNGIKLVVSPGMPTNIMVAAVPSNLWYGTDLESDVEDILVIPQLD